MKIGTIILLVVAALVAVGLFAARARVKNFWEAVKKFLREVRVEMARVAWPTRNDIIASTIVVLLAVVVLTVIVSAWDQLISWIVRWIIPGGGA